MKSKLVAISAIGCLAALAVLVTVRVRFAPDVDYPIGEERQMDDFGLVVRAVHRESGNLEVKAEVRNHAKIVSFKFPPDMVHAYDADGRELPLSPHSASLQTIDIPAGESAEQDLVFLGPISAGPVRLVFGQSDLAADFLEALFFGKTHTEVNP